MKPTLNELGKICFGGSLSGNEVSGGSIRKAGYSVEEVLAMESESEQRKVLAAVEQNRRLERAREDAEDSGGRSSSVNFFGSGTVNIGGTVSGGDVTIHRRRSD